MANAATIAGLAFSNAFVGVNHALAHAVGARFGDRRTGAPTGSSCPTCCATTPRCPAKFMPAPGYSAYVAPEKYAQLAWVVLGGRGEESRRRLFRGVESCSTGWTCRGRCGRWG